MAEQAFDAKPAHGPPGQCGDPALLQGCWFTYDPDGNFTLGVAEDAPHSPPGILSIRFPAGLPPGSGPGLVQGWSAASEGFEKDYRAIRESGWIRVPTPSFEVQRVGVKFLGYVGVGRQQADALPIQLLFFSQAATGGVSSPFPAVNVSVIQQAYMDRKLEQNVLQGPVFTFGEWHEYEFLMVLNDVGKANGRLRMWMDGQLLMDYSDVEYRTVANPGGFFGRRWDPVWGGQGGEARSRDDFLQIDHVRIVGVPMPSAP